MKKVYVFLADGFEEVEALTPVDILRRAGATVKTVSASKSEVVTGARGVPVVADMRIDTLDIGDADLIIIPGGYPGFENLAASDKVMAAVDTMCKQNRLVAAICGAPAVVLGKNGYLKGKKAVCYPGMEKDLDCKEVSDHNVCIDGNIITSKSAATAMEFSIALTRILMGDEICENVKKSIVYGD